MFFGQLEGLDDYDAFLCVVLMIEQHNYISYKFNKSRSLGWAIERSPAGKFDNFFSAGNF